MTTLFLLLFVIFEYVIVIYLFLVIRSYMSMTHQNLEVKVEKKELY